VRAIRRLVGALVAGVALALPATALAIAPELTEPPAGSTVASAPASVRVVVPSPVATAFLRLRVTDPAGRVVSGPARRDPRDDDAIVAPLVRPARGALQVEWRVLTRDGHPAGGRYALGVGAPAALAPAPAVTRSDTGPLPVAARLLWLVGPLGMLGLVALSAGVAGPALREGGIARPREPAAEVSGRRERVAAALAGAARGWWRAWWAMVATGAAALVLLPAATLWGLREGPGALGTLLGTRVAVAWWVTLAGLVVASLVALARRRAGGSPPGDAVWGIAMGAPPAITLIAISWAGHASSGDDRLLNIAIDAIHNGATAVWLGGLLGLVVLVTPAVGRLDRDDRVRAAAACVVAFSALALTAVTLLVVTGVYRALAEVPVSDLADTGYGRALLVKLGLFALLLVGGAFNRMVVHPRLERAALGLDPDDRGAAAALRVSVRAELALAAVLLVAVAVLVSSAPPG
jgi:copper transport protein